MRHGKGRTVGMAVDLSGKSLMCHVSSTLFTLLAALIVKPCSHERVLPSILASACI